MFHEISSERIIPRWRNTLEIPRRYSYGWIFQSSRATCCFRRRWTGRSIISPRRSARRCRVRGSANFSNYRRNILLSADDRRREPVGKQTCFFSPLRYHHQGIFSVVVRGDECTRDDRRTKKISLGASTRYVKKEANVKIKKNPRTVCFIMYGWRRATTSRCGIC